MLRTDAYYRELAGRWVVDTGLIEPPIPLERIASALGVPAVAAHLPRWFRAALVYEDGLPTLLINENTDSLARRLAIAHVLGHMLIVLDDQDMRYPRTDPAGHRPADVIADELIAPSALVRDQAAKWFNDYRYLAGLFGVPEERMLEKMRELGIIRSRGVAWDF